MDALIFRQGILTPDHKDEVLVNADPAAYLFAFREAIADRDVDQTVRELLQNIR